MRIQRSLFKMAGLAAALSLSVSAFASNITGAGATFPYAVYTKWAEAYKAATGKQVNYQGIGSSGGIMLGLGRALGETMAVTFVIGNANRIVGSLCAPGTSIAATLANEFGEAAPGLHISALFALGLVLFLITFVVLAISRWLIRRGVARQGK